MTKKDRMYERIRQHGENLQAIFPATKDLAPIFLSKRLRHAETEAHRLTTNYCNGAVDSEEYDQKADALLARLDKLLNFTAQGVPVFVNGDARGYALKIRDEYVRDHGLKIHTDWGGFGVLAPDLTED